MKAKSKKFKTSIMGITAAAALSLCATFAVLGSSNGTALAAERYVTIDGTSVFYTSVQGAEVKSVAETDDSGASKYYTLFEIEEDETVTYRKNLAYKWYTGKTTTDSDGNEVYTGESELNRFSMEIGFEDLSFKNYVIKFQSQQNSGTEDGITTNYLVFSPKAETTDTLIVRVFSMTKDEEKEDNGFESALDKATGNEISWTATTKIAISFGDFDNGKYPVNISTDGGSTGTKVGDFKNVYEPYAKYVASGDSAVMPMTFSAEFNDDDTTKLAKMKVYSLNGQSFETYDEDGDGIYDEVRDTAPPVMCFTTTPSYVSYGEELDFDYTIIDVLASSPRSTAYYYVLTGEQYALSGDTYGAADFTYCKVDDDSLYTTVSSSSDVTVTRDPSTTFVPSDLVGEDNADKNGYTTYGLIKVYFKISDTSSNAQSDYVFVDWYANQDCLVDINGASLKNDDNRKDGKFIKLIGENTVGATYYNGTAEGDVLQKYKDRITAIEQEYQKLIEAAIAEQGENGKLYAGSDDKFYLPNFTYATDDFESATDLEYTIYYKAKTSSSSSSLSYNNLSLSLSEADVTYKCTIYVTDSDGNPMRYPKEVDSNGDIVWEEIETTDVWESDFSDLLPFFEFSVSYKSATVEDSDEDSKIGYVGTTYSNVSFEINGLSGYYSTEYKLYVFDRSTFYDETQINLSYEDFTANVGKLFSNTYQDGLNSRKYFKTIKDSSTILETDEDYDEMSEYAWSASNVTFVPQSASEYYVVELDLTDNQSKELTTKYQTVRASVEITALKGESDWLENNVASVVLLSVAGVCLVSLIVLLIVKPKDKGDIDAVYAREEEKAAKKRNKKKKEISLDEE